MELCKFSLPGSFFHSNDQLSLLYGVVASEEAIQKLDSSKEIMMNETNELERYFKMIFSMVSNQYLLFFVYNAKQMNYQSFPISKLFISIVNSCDVPTIYLQSCAAI